MEIIISFLYERYIRSFHAVIFASLCFVTGLFTPGVGSAAITVDGRPDEPDWNSARKYSGFVVVDPLTLEAPRLSTEAWILSLPEGLAVAFICEQPPEVPRTRTVTPQDATRFDSDAVSFMIDLDGSRTIAYEFSVSITGSYREGTITNEVNTSYEWDGAWQRAVTEEETRWTVEMLIPWSIAAMQEGSGDKRLIGVCFQRELHATNELYSFPGATTSRSRFVSDFSRMEVTRYSATEFYVVPYITVLSDLVKNHVSEKAGTDLFWKPSGKFQIAATFNPDFGQVESDDLVIDFSAIETLFSDKRPFFTENQGIFSSVMPLGNSLFYTRRIGGPHDRDGGASDIEGALKAIGSIGAVNYGVFAAREENDDGRRFYAGRLVLPFENWSIGTHNTFVKRPFLNRTALVGSVDYNLNLSPNLRIVGMVFGSDIDAETGESRGYGFFNVSEYSVGDRWQFNFSWSRYDDKVDISDMGYLRRNNIEEIFFRLERKWTDFPETSRKASVSWGIRCSFPRTIDDVRLQGFMVLSRMERMRSGADTDLSLQLTPSGYDDLISRGHGVVWMNERLDIGASYSMPRDGAWRKSLRLNLFQEGINDWAASIEGNVTWYPLDKLNFDVKLKPVWSSDWLIWIRDAQFGQFSKRQITGEISSNWFPFEGHELRLRAQWIAINADAEQSYDIGEHGRLVADNTPLDSFAALNFGLQIRYRWEIAPMSDLYVVYSRGGKEQILNPSGSTLDLLEDSTSLREADQMLVKLRYRF